MNAQDRQLLDALNLRQQRLEIAVADLRDDLQLFTNRFATPEFVPPPRVAEAAPVLPPPIPEPTESASAPPLPPIPPVMPPIPPEPPPVPPIAPPVVDGPGFEIQFGRWLARIGVVFALLTLVYGSVVAYEKYHQFIGPWERLGVLALVSGGLIATGMRLERTLLVYGRTLAGGGLACLYYTLYGATYVPQLKVIPDPILGGFFLLAWSGGVLYLAERRKSELLSIFAISLAYFSSAITPVGSFTMVADLILAATAVAFLVRNAWTGLSYLCLIGTYLGFVRQLAVDQPDMLLGFQFVEHLDFWPSAIYLTGAWLIFTAGIFLAKAPGFDGSKRMAFLCLNNGAWTGLLTLDVFLSHHGHLGGTLMLAGGALAGAWLLARTTRATESDLANAYLMQGLALATGGAVIAYSGVTRGLILVVESVFLAAAGAYSRNVILRIVAAIAAVFGAIFVGCELFTFAHPWILTGAGVLAMFANAWFARFDYWREPFEAARARFVPASAGYILLAIGLLVTGFVRRGTIDWIGPDLAVTALILSAAIYLVPLFELPPLSQILVVIAQVFYFAWPLLVGPNDASWPYVGFHAPLWSQNVIALVTILFVLWWPRQTRVIKGAWLAPLMWLYAIAMVAFTYNSVHPHMSNEGWMMAAAALSLVFLAFGAWNRAWAFVAAGQILLGLSVYAFLRPEYSFDFPWTWCAALVPIAVVFLTGWIARQVLAYAFDGDGAMRTNLRIASRFYQSLAIAMLVRWIYGVVASDEITFALFAVATAFVGGGLLGSSSYFVRAGLVLDFFGLCNYLFAAPMLGDLAFRWLDAGAFALFLAQPALLRQWGREIIADGESWVVVLVSSAAGWIFVCNSMLAGHEDNNLTLGWALFALALTLIGFAGGERRQRWCGLGILAAAFVRVGVHDFWRFSDVGKVLTFLALTVVCLGLSFLYYKFADKWKEWL